MDERWRASYDAWKTRSPEDDDDYPALRRFLRRLGGCDRDPDDARDAQQDREMRGDDRDMGDD